MSVVKFQNGLKRNGFNPLFTDVFESIFNETVSPERYAAKIPAVNIAETKDEYQIELAAPGLKKEDFKINLDQNVLIISSEKKAESTEEGKTYNRREYSYSTFNRSFTLPDSADYAGIEAEYTDGVLKITVAKKEEAKPVSKEIVIK